MKRAIFFILAFGLAGLAATLALVQIKDTPKFDEVRAHFHANDRIILDRNAQLIDEVGTDKTRRLGWVKLENVPRALVESLQAAESPVSENLADLLAKPEDRRGVAGVIEVTWTKHDILEAYMNLAHYRPELQGVAAASYGIFAKPPTALSPAEAALLVALLRAPTIAAAREPACRILAETGAAEQCGLLSAEHLAYLEQSYRMRPYLHMAPPVAKRLAEDLPRKGSVLRSTLDRDMQWTAMHALQERNTPDGALVVIENSTGHVLAYVSNAAAADAATALKAAGGLLKPMLYAKALDERILTSSTVLNNGEGKFASVKEAIKFNLELPAVQALQSLGTDLFVQTMTELGFTGLHKPDSYGPSLALGAIDVPLLEAANAYRTLANHGVWSPVRFSPDKLTDEGPRRVFSQAAAFVVSNVLAERKDNWFVVAVDAANRWCIGYSERYTVGVWSDNPRDVWQTVMTDLHRQDTSHAAEPPPNLTRVGSDWYLSGTGPTLAEAPAADNLHSRISYPVNRSMIALDEDLARSNNRVFIQIVAPRMDQNLYMNGVRLGHAHAFQPWEPYVGRFVLELRDSGGQVVDKVRFEVAEHRPVAAVSQRATSGAVAGSAAYKMHSGQY